MTETRDQIAYAMGWTNGHFGDVLDAIMAIVDPITQQRDHLNNELAAARTALLDRVGEVAALKHHLAHTVVLPRDWRQHIHDVLTSGGVTAVADLLESWRVAAVRP
jgi:hypothetical protein